MFVYEHIYSEPDTQSCATQNAHLDKGGEVECDADSKFSLANICLQVIHTVLVETSHLMNYSLYSVKAA